MSEHPTPPPLPSGHPPDPGKLRGSVRRTPFQPFRPANLAIIVLALGIIYLAYFWAIRRVVVGPDQVLALVKKNGSRSLPGRAREIDARHAGDFPKDGKID